MSSRSLKWKRNTPAHCNNKRFFFLYLWRRLIIHFDTNIIGRFSKNGSSVDRIYNVIVKVVQPTHKQLKRFNAGGQEWQTKRFIRGKPLTRWYPSWTAQLIADLQTVYRQSRLLSLERNCAHLHFYLIDRAARNTITGVSALLGGHI